MAPDTLFLQPIVPISNSNPNFADAKGNALTTDYSHNPSGTLTQVEVKTLVEGGVATAIAQAQALYINDPAFSAIFTNSAGVGEEGAFQGSSQSETKMVGNFSVGANQKFSFDFLANLKLSAKEIENPNAEYNQAESTIAFVLFDTSNISKPKILDYFGVWSNLISSEGKGELNFAPFRHLKITDSDETIDIDGNNGSDSVKGTILGTYERTFRGNTDLTLVQINKSAVKFLGDTLIGNLGEDVIYGTIRDDNLRGNNGSDKIYSSLGDDIINGKKGDDILEAGQGEDRLYGDRGNDTLVGGSGDDVFVGNIGDDFLAGGEGRDLFYFNTAKMGVDKISDFETGTDKIVLSPEIFTVLTNSGNGTIDTAQFSVVENDAIAALSGAFITYSTDTGNLFYNQNGDDSGLGTGGQFAVLEGIPTLAAGDFTL